MMYLVRGLKVVFVNCLKLLKTISYVDCFLLCNRKYAIGALMLIALPMITSNYVKLGGHTLNVPSMKTWVAYGINDFWKSEQKQIINKPFPGSSGSGYSNLNSSKLVPL